jgi:hypothetical protein
MTSDTLLPPVTTSSPNHSQNADNAAEASEANNSQAEKSFENGGSNSVSSNPQNLSPQDLPLVTTSPNQGGNTPSSPETHANKRHGNKLADEMREVLASSSTAAEKRTAAREVWKQFEGVPLSQRGQQRGFFWQSLQETDEENKARLLLFTDLVEGEKLKYVGKEEQYQGLELTAYSADGTSKVTVTCRKPDGYLTTWIPLKDLRRL